MPRLDQLLARNLGLSRREVTRLLRTGRVSDLDGTRLDDARLPLLDSSLPRDIRVDGERCTLRDRFHLLQHKPRDVVTALRDGRHPTAYALLRDQPLFAELRPVGRLDLDCSGLLLWTTEGSLVHRLAHPKHAVPREYQVALAQAFEPLPPALVLDDGHRPRVLELAGLAAADAHPALSIPRATRCLARIVLVGGRFHEVKRIFAALGSHVLGLARVRYGDIPLPPSLAPGACIELDLSTHLSESSC